MLSSAKPATLRLIANASGAECSIKVRLIRNDLPQ
jgi:hypothetical protein